MRDKLREKLREKEGEREREKEGGGEGERWRGSIRCPMVSNWVWYYSYEELYLLKTTLTKYLERKLNPDRRPWS